MRKIGVFLMLGEIFLLTISVRSSNGQFAGSVVYDPGDDHFWIMNVDGSQRVSVTDGQGELIIQLGRLTRKKSLLPRTETVAGISISSIATELNFGT